MNLMDRIIWMAIALTVGAVAIQAALPAIVIVAAVGTVCFVVIRLVIYYTSRW
jgi:hypothetical protein